MNASRSFPWGIFAGRTPNLVMKFWPKKNTKFEVRTKPPCGYTFTAGLELSWPTFPALNSDDFSFFWFLYCSSWARVRRFKTSINIFQNLINLLSGPRPKQPAGGWLWLQSFWLLAALGLTVDFSNSGKSWLWSLKRSNLGSRRAIEEPKKRKIIRI